MTKPTCNQGINQQLIFDRLAGNDHPLADGLNDLKNATTISNWVLGENIQMDWRVSTHREKGMLNFKGFQDLIEGKNLIHQWRRYYNIEVRNPSGINEEDRLPAYLRKFNASNKITTRIPPFYQLLHICSFNRMIKSLISTRLYGNSSEFGFKFEDLTGITLPERTPGSTLTDDEFNVRIDEIANYLNGSGEDIVKRTAGLLCRSFVKSMQPWWACFADDASGFIKSGNWGDLCACLGMGHINDGEWILIWRYKRGEVGDLYRPTVVEANDSPYHFPSPPSSKYGVTMPLNSNLPNFREVVHNAPEGSILSEACIGELYKIEQFNSRNANYGRIPSMRSSHSNRLMSEFVDKDDNEWIKRYKIIA